MRRVCAPLMFMAAMAGWCEAAQDPAAAPKTGLLPIPDYSGGFWDNKYLTRDWDGLRSSLAEKGLTLNLAFTQVAQGVAEGGLEREWRYGGKVDALLNIDLDRMGLLPGALVTLRTESRYGESGNEIAGTLLPVNDVMYFPLTQPSDDDLFIALTEFRYTQFLAKQFGVFAGKFTTLGGDVNEFAAGRGDTQFLSHSFLSASVTALINPYSTVGGGVIVMPNDSIVLSSSVYSSADSSTTSGFRTLDEGWVWSSTLRGQYRLAGLPGGMSLTGQYGFNNDFIDFEGQFITRQGVALPRDDDTWNVFWNGWQYLYVEQPSETLINVTDGRTDRQGAGVFARAAIADRSTNPVPWVLSGGLSGRGNLPGRDNDTWGIGYAYAKLREQPFLTGFVLESQAQRFEAYYCVAVTPAVELSFDVQWADSLFTNVDEALILAVRLRIAF